jgi:hypothetical protein
MPIENHWKKPATSRQLSKTIWRTQGNFWTGWERYEYKYEIFVIPSEAEESLDSW